MKLIKTRLRSSLNDTSLSHLMKITIESPDELRDSNLEEVVDTWNRKGCSILLIVLYCYLFYLLRICKHGSCMCVCVFESVFCCDFSDVYMA